MAAILDKLKTIAIWVAILAFLGWFAADPQPFISAGTEVIGFIKRLASGAISGFTQLVSEVF